MQTHRNKRFRRKNIMTVVSAQCSFYFSYYYFFTQKK